MVSATVPVDKHETHVEEHESSSSTTHAPSADDAKKTTSAPVNVWKVRKEAMKAPSAESDAEKRVESIIENIKEVTLGKLSDSIWPIGALFLSTWICHGIALESE